jgi:alcohol dehydrogenase (NADP+)
MNTPSQTSNLRLAKMPLNFGSGAIPALGFGTLIPDPAETRRATTDAVRAGFRHFDCAERYRNEREVGESLRAEFVTGAIAREDVFITTKLWNTNHRPERVEPAFDASCQRLGIDYVDLYLIHTPFAFQPGDNFDPRDQKGNIV